MSDLTKKMADAAGDFLAALDSGQRAQATYPVDDMEREAWFYTPTQHGGIPLSAMDPVQQQLSQKLVATGVSSGGYVTTSTIMGLERTLAFRENFLEAPYPGVEGPSRFRDPGLYFISIFGEPGNDPWGWRFEGHHVSLNYVIGGDTVRPLPTFFGANPADSDGVGGTPLRPLALEEDLGRDLVMALDAEQRAKAVMSPVAPPDLITTNVATLAQPLEPREPWQIMRSADEGLARRARRSQQQQEEYLGFTEDMAVTLAYTVAPKGLQVSAMDGDQRDIVTTLLRQYIQRLPDDLADTEWARVAGGSALDGVHFVWAGSTEKHEGHYYRLQGPELFVEYDNTQNGANHIHSVWRDPKSDFGRDLLAEHYAEAH